MDGFEVHADDLHEMFKISWKDFEVEEEKEQTIVNPMTPWIPYVVAAGFVGNQYYKTYMNKCPYRIPQQTGYQWTLETLNDDRDCYSMFRMIPKVFYALHEALVQHCGLRSTRLMTSLVLSIILIDGRGSSVS